MYPKTIEYACTGLKPPPNNLGFANPEVSRDIREQLYAARSAGFNIGFEQFLAHWAHAKITSGDPVAKVLLAEAEKSPVNLANLKVGAIGSPSQDEKTLMAMYMNDIGIESLDTVKVSALISAQPGVRGIWNELIRRALIQGINMSPIGLNVVSNTQSLVNSPTIILPTATVGESTPELVAEAGSFPFAMVSFDHRSIFMKKFGIAIRATDEAIRYCTFDVLAALMQQQGQKLGMVKDSRICAVLLNGDQDNGSMSPAVIGVEDIAAGFQYVDWVRINLYLQCVGIVPNTILTGIEQALKLLQLPEFKEPIYRQGDQTFITIPNTNLKVARATKLLVKSNYPTGKITIGDSTNGLIQTNGRPLLTEKDRDIFTETSAVKMSEEVCYGNKLREAFITVDVTKTYTGDFTFTNPNYTWLKPHDAIPIK